MTLSTGELLEVYAHKLTRYGPDHPEPAAFVRRHAENAEFVELAEIALALWRELTPR